MVIWTTDTRTKAEYETAVRVLGAEPTTTEEGNGAVRVSAELPGHYEAAIRVLIKGGVAPKAITHGLIESVAARLEKNK